MCGSPCPTPSDLWFLANAQPLGLYLRVTDPPRAKALLYSARQRLPADLRARVAHLQIRTAPNSPSDTLWLMHPPPKAESVSEALAQAERPSFSDLLSADLETWARGGPTPNGR